MQPGADAPILQNVPVKLPPLSPGVCAVHPQLLAHPTSFNHLVLAWAEGGNALNPCPIEVGGGQMRLGLIGIGGKGTVFGNPADCPSGVALPVAWRVALHLAAPVNGNPENVSELSGLLARPSLSGTLTWVGAYPGGWAGAGKFVNTAAYADFAAQAQASRPVLSDAANSAVLLSLTQFNKLANDAIPSVDAIKVALDGTLAATAKSIVTSVDLNGTAATFRAVEAAWDPDASRIGIAISGTIVQAGVTKGFLAFGRATAEQAALSKPSVVQLFEPPLDYVGSPVIQSFRVAEIPASTDFLLVWSMPNSTNLQIMRLQPIDDKQMIVKLIQSLATDFISHASGDLVSSSGGLSELVIAPVGQRFSIAYEAIGALRILTAPIPQ